MLIKLQTAWLYVRDSLWFLPGLITALAVVLAIITVQIDGIVIQGRADLYLAFGGGVEGARAVLSAIASTTITVTGVVFSITIVALQLASSQYSPRVLRNFTTDRANHVVLGVFIGTFTYSLLVLRTVRSATDLGSVFVPSISVAVAIGLALTSIALLIFYIHHAARSIQASIIVDRATHDTLGLIDHLFPDPVGKPRPDEAEVPAPAHPPALLSSEDSGYLQNVDAAALFRAWKKNDDGAVERLVIRVEPHIGEYVLPGWPLASIWPAEAVDEHLSKRVRGAFVLGPERTLHQDLDFGFRQLADIAIKALSPGINDPTTAINCIDRLGQLLVTLGNREPPEPVRTDDQGHVQFFARQTTFRRAVDVGFDQIRHYGAGDPVVATHIMATLGRVAALVPAARRAPVERQIDATLRAARASTNALVDLERLERAAQIDDDSRTDATLAPIGRDRNAIPRVRRHTP